MKSIEVRTKSRAEIVDITHEVERLLEGSGVALVFTPHTTASIILNEAEDGLLLDILESLERIVPKANYRHNRIDDNAEAHIKASLLGCSVLVPFENGKLRLGTWQRILFLEFDGPRVRKVFVKEL